MGKTKKRIRDILKRALLIRPSLGPTKLHNSGTESAKNDEKCRLVSLFFCVFVIVRPVNKDYYQRVSPSDEYLIMHIFLNTLIENFRYRWRWF